MQREMAGWTLVEGLVVVGLIGLLLGLAQPTLSDLMLRHRLLGAVETYQGHLQWARQQAVQHRRGVRLGFGESPDGTCYDIQFTPALACTCSASQASCPAGTQLIARAWLPRSEHIAVRPKGSSGQVFIHHDLGTFQPTLTAVFTASDGRTVHQITNLMGRTRSCSPSGAWASIPGC